VAAAAAPTSMPQARPRSAMEATQVHSIPDAMHTAAMGSVMAGSAFSARKTLCARPDARAFRSCLAPTTIRSLLKSGKDPHWGILLSFLVSIQNHIIRRFSEKSTAKCAFPKVFFRFFPLHRMTHTNQNYTIYFFFSQAIHELYFYHFVFVLNKTRR
jgi:hypothetical protein